MDPHATKVYRLNFPTTPICQDDIKRLSVDEMLRLARLSTGQLDVLDGSPPCQGFSTVGARRIDDPRNLLFMEYVRLLSGARPRAFVMENVSGLVKGKMRLVFVDMLRALKGAGYRVACRLLDAQYFGVPQSRQRTIFIGVRDDLMVEPTHPNAMCRPISADSVLRSVVRMREGFGPTMPVGLRNSDFANKWRSMRRPSCTIVRTRAPMLLMPDGSQRAATADECAALSSFPPDFRWSGSEAQRINRIGNSVPPLFAAAIATHVCKLLVSAGGRREKFTGKSAKRAPAK
jgi:DNA (cytosine-5)-methyltransferase 1